MKPTNQDVIKYLSLRLDSLESMIGHFIEMGIDCEEEKKLHNQLSDIQGKIMDGGDWESYLEFTGGGRK